MVGEVLDVEISVKVRADVDGFAGGVGGAGALVFGDDYGEGFVADFGVVGYLEALFGESFGSDEFGVGVGGGPFGEEDVVFKVRGDEVADVAA